MSDKDRIAHLRAYIARHQRAARALREQRRLARLRCDPIASLKLLCSINERMAYIRNARLELDELRSRIP